MTSIGYATLQIIPSLDGVSKSVDKQLGFLPGRGKTVGKQLGASIAEGVRASESDVKRAFDNQAKLADRAADATGKLKVAQAGYQDLVEKGVRSGQRFERAKAAVEKATRDETRATRSATDALKEYENAQKAAASAGDKMGSGFGAKLKGLAGGARSGGIEAASGFVEGFGGPIAALGTKAGPIGVALAAAVGLGALAGGLLAKQVLSGLDQLQSQANVAAKLGLSPEQMRPIADAAAQAYAGNFGESVEANMDAARAAIQSGLLDPNATRADVQAMVEQLSTVSDVMGEEIPAVARSASQAIKTGLATDATGAMDLLVRATQNGLNVSEDLLDTVDEYGTQFRKVGLSGDEAFGLIAQAAKGGARDTDVAADAIKEFTLQVMDVGNKDVGAAFDALGLNVDTMQNRFAQGGDTAKQAMIETLDRVRALDDPLKKNTVSLGLFGTKAEDMGAALGALDLRTAVQQFGEVDGAVKRAADTMGGTGASSIESAKRSVEVAVGKVQQGLGAAFTPALTSLGTWVSDHSGEILDFLTGIGEITLRSVQIAVNALGSLVKGVALVGEALGDLAGFALQGMAALEDAFGDKDLAERLRKNADEAFGFGEGLDGIADKMLHFSADNMISDMKAAAASAKETQDKVKQLGDAVTTLPDGTVVINDNAPDAEKRITDVGLVVKQLPDGKRVVIEADTSQAKQEMSNFLDSYKKLIVQPQVAPPTYTPGDAGSVILPSGGRAGGGVVDPSGIIRGPGSGTSDSILAAVMGGSGGFIRVSNDESINTAASTRANWPVIAAMNAGADLAPWFKSLPGLAGGGLVDAPDVSAAQSLSGTPYSKDLRFDCSGSVARVINSTLGTGGGLMTTKTAREWLAARGFVEGSGGPGQISVGWYDRGPNPNDGHMAMTLSNGLNAEAGGKNGVFTIGGTAAGANDPQFDHHMYLPQMFGEGLGGSSGGSSWAAAASSAAGGGTPGIGPNGEQGTYSAPDAKTVREANQKVADADDRVREAEARRRELEADAKESQKISADSAVQKATREAADARADRDEALKGKFTAGQPGSSGGGGIGFNLPSAFSGLASIGLNGLGLTTQVSPNTPQRTFEFGNALGSAVSGQLSSALDVFGVGDSPGWLQGLSTLIGEISIGGSGGGNIFGGAAPVSALTPGDSPAALDPSDVHGARGGQAPGPGVVYSPVFNTNDDTAFRDFQRFANERVGAKLGSL
jgi:hypothetical protein